MKNYLLIPAAALFILIAAPALGAYDAWPPTDFSQFAPADAYEVSTNSPAPVFFFVVLAFLFVLGATIAMGTSSSTDAHRLPKELQPRHSAEHYDQEAARVRAFSRKLTADAELAESQLRTSLKQDELKEFESFLRDRKAPRRK